MSAAQLSHSSPAAHSPATPARFPGSDLSYLLSFSPTSPIKALYYAEGDDSDSDTVVSLT